MREHALCLLFLVLAASLSGVIHAAENLIRNPGFEDSGEGIPAWVAHNWANNVADYRMDRDRPRSGTSCLRMQLVQAVHADRIECFQRLPRCQPGDVLAISLWVRGPDNALALDVMLNRNSPPWGDCEWARFPVRFGESWSQHRAIVKLPERFTPDDLVLNLHLTSTISVWIDDVVVERVTGADQRPAVAGNRLPNGSFEVGVLGWTCTGPFWPRTGSYQPFLCGAGDAWRLTTPVDAEALDGRRVLAFAVGDNMREASLGSPWFPLRYGHEAVVRYAVRGPAGGVLRTGLLHGASGREERIEHTVTSDGTWQQRELRGVPGPSAQDAYFVQFVTDSPGQWRIDAVDVREAGLPATPPRLDLALVPVEPLPPGGFVDPGTTVRWRVDAVGQPGARVPVRILATNLTNEVLHQEAGVLVLDGNGFASLAVAPLTINALGPVRLEVLPESLLPQQRPQADAYFQVLPVLPPAAGVSDRFFACQVSTLGESELSMAARVGARTIRFGEMTKWCFAEPDARGVYDLDPVPAALKRVRDRGMGILATLGYNPEWAIDRSHPVTPSWMRYNHVAPANWQDWRRYVATVVGKTGHAVEAFELLNEVDLDQYMTVPPNYPGGRSGLYRRYAQETRAALAEAGLTAKLVGPASSNPANPWVAEFMAADDYKPFDVVSFHYYGLNAGAYASLVRSWQAGAKRPLWVSEGAHANNAQCWLRAVAPPTANPSGIADLTAGTVRWLATWKALGIARCVQYPGPQRWGGGMPQNDFEWKFGDDIYGNPLPNWSGYAGAVAMLEGAHPHPDPALAFEHRAVGDGQVTICRFVKPQQITVEVWWADRPLQPGAVELPSAGQWHDWFSNPAKRPAQLTGQPWYRVVPATASP